MKPTGGRGKTAPYVSTHVRVPVPVKHIVEKVIEKYRQRLTDGSIPPVYKDLEELYLLPENLLTGNAENSETMVDVEEAVKLAKEILKLKKSARVSVEKLLTAIYNQEISLQ